MPTSGLTVCTWDLLWAVGYLEPHELNLVSLCLGLFLLPFFIANTTTPAKGTISMFITITTSTSC